MLNGRANEGEADSLFLTPFADISCSNLAVVYQTKKLREIILGKRLLLER